MTNHVRLNEKSILNTENIYKFDISYVLTSLSSYNQFTQIHIEIPKIIEHLSFYIFTNFEMQVMGKFKSTILYIRSLFRTNGTTFS